MGGPSSDCSIPGMLLDRQDEEYVNYTRQELHRSNKCLAIILFIWTSSGGDGPSRQQQQQRQMHTAAVEDTVVSERGLALWRANLVLLSCNGRVRLTAETMELTSVRCR